MRAALRAEIDAIRSSWLLPNCSSSMATAALRFATSPTGWECCPVRSITITRPRKTCLSLYTVKASGASCKTFRKRFVARAIHGTTRTRLCRAYQRRGCRESDFQVTATGLFAIYETRLQRRLRSDRENFEQLFRQLIADLDLPDGTDRSLFRLALLGSLNWTHVWYKTGKKTPREIAAQLISTSRTKRGASAAADGLGVA